MTSPALAPSSPESAAVLPVSVPESAAALPVSVPESLDELLPNGSLGFGRPDPGTPEIGIGPILQRGTGPIRAAHYVPAGVDTVLWGRLPAAGDAPILSVDSGTEVTIDTVSHEGLLEDQGGDPATFFGAHGVPRNRVLDDAVEIASLVPRNAGIDGPHVVSRPIEVRGARPGDVLGITLVEALRRVPYGVISNRHGRGALPDRFPEGPENVSVFSPVMPNDPTDLVADAPAHGSVPLRTGAPGSGGDPRTPTSGSQPGLVDGVAPGRATFPLRPFLGIMGVVVAETERPHSVPPGMHGGNIDVSLLVPGTTIYLPVQVAGALAYVGDPHFAQGDGEVSLTALEASLRVTVRFDLVPAAAAAARWGTLSAPLIETPEFLVPCGLGDTLDEAMRACVGASVALLGARFDMEPHLAYAYLSAATDFRISQVVDRVVGVHATIRRSDFEGDQNLGALIAASESYEAALAANDTDALDTAFIEGPDALRADAHGILRGSEAISRFRGRRGGTARREVVGRDVRWIDPHNALMVIETRTLSGGRGLNTQHWTLGPGGWRIALAQVAAPAAAIDPAVWRIVGTPLVPASADGVLAGERIAVKDLFAVAGQRIGAGVPAYLAEAESENEIEPVHAPALAALLEAGAEVTGIAQTDEFAYGLTGTSGPHAPAANPAAPGHLPGGSTSGPAVAVASGQVSIGLGTDTAGSIRVPAAYQGLWGLRTTHGLVSRAGVLPLAPSFDTVGWLTRSPELLGRVLEASVPGLSVEASVPEILCLPELLTGVAPDVLSAYHAALERLTSQGLTITELAPAHLAEVPEVFRVVQAGEAHAAHGEWVAAHPGTLDPAVVERFRAAANLDPVVLSAAITRLPELRAHLNAALGERVVLLPTTPGPAPRVDADLAELDRVRAHTLRLTTLASLTGRPALAFPVPRAPGALPIGLSLIGPPGSEYTLLALAETLFPSTVREI
ncbi:Asp-tRNA(Asn)/Glu-tRNA(Gln) amidotransferase A subunit family amidase/acetamidase/formamidase [Mycetocola sp. BIGb0189]|uniref:AtzH-like domain-containing protein n=1 Tax=Mycetocola sp. BIGb0189 TaxID=2940604 RepID=UPI002167BC81|nr:AtzH-like domain-containing protein [Mycetocola sp. BIGb0189]MCS4277742.1 Asp-tRNA(Asn)/Glu-tRNA(Gln) amidotransferase A subunit family amidase/acetamidase/formamidase [Mycetocola sp. BIGb0189]